MQGVQGSIPGWEAKIPHAACSTAKNKQMNKEVVSYDDQLTHITLLPSIHGWLTSDWMYSCKKLKHQKSSENERRRWVSADPPFKAQGQRVHGAWQTLCIGRVLCSLERLYRWHRAPRLHPAPGCFSDLSHSAQRSVLLVTIICCISMSPLSPPVKHLYFPFI